MNKLKLIYGNMRALCEAPQMMMRYSNIEYSYKMVWDHFGKKWVDIKKEIIFNRLPILIINEKEYLWQSNSITRYIAKISKTIPKDNYLSSYADAVFESTHEMFYPLNPTVNIFIAEKFKENKEKLLKQILPNTLDNFEKLQKKHKGDFFLGIKPYYCDFNAFHHFSLIKLLDNNIIEDYPLIKNFMNAFENLNGIKNYLLERPKLVDIGIAPKFIINNKEFPTGLNPNKNL